jgi:uncharacterized repeat protein (TIGR01451 family)
MPLKARCSRRPSLQVGDCLKAICALHAEGSSVTIALLLICFAAAGSAQQRRIVGGCNASDADGRSLVRVQQRGPMPLNLCEGRLLGRGRAPAASGDPLALASADLDGDGVPDLISGFASGMSGSITVHRGNVQGLWPYGAAALNGTPEPFFPNARTFSLPERPDFVVTGDFNADGRLDVLTGQRGSSALFFLRGDGRGGLLAAKRVELSGTLNALISGDINRADGLTDVIVSVNTASGPRAVVYESPKGAISAEPEIFKLPHAATALALGRFDGGPMNSLAIGAGDQLLIVHGRDRQLSRAASQRTVIAPASITQQTLPFTITAIASGDFTGTGPAIAALGSDRRVHILEGPLSQRLLSDAALSNPNFIPSMQVAHSDGKSTPYIGTLTPGMATKLAILRNAGHSKTSVWIERSVVELPSGFSQRVPQLLAARVTGSSQEDILAPDSSNNQVHVLATPRTTQTPRTLSPHAARSATIVRAPMQLLASLQSESAPAAVLPMRLGRHGLNGLVMLQSGQTSPVLMPQDVPPANIFTVTNTLDAAKTDAPVGSLRYAMNQVESASGDNGGGSYEIDFNIPTSDPGYNPSTGSFLIRPISESVPGALDDFALPPINATVIIDGYTQPGASPNTLSFGDNAKVLIQIDGSAATTPGGSGLVPFNDIGSVFRGLDFTGWTVPDINNNTASGAEGIEANGVGDFIEGNFFGTDPTGKVAAPNRIGIFADNGPLFGSLPGNIIGGTTPQARNILSGNNSSGILFLSTAFEAQLQGNFIGLDSTGATFVPNPQEANRSNVFDGAGLNGSTVTIGGTLPGSANFIAGNGTNVDLNDLTDGGAASDSNVQGNVIGLNAAGTAGFPNQGYGVSMLHGVSNMTIGGTTTAARNVISGNLAGVYVFDNSFNNIVQGNYIGTDPAGAKAIPNVNQGFISGSTGSTETAAGNTLIGGIVPGAGNVISGNTLDGVNISGVSLPPGSQTYAGNSIQGNFIGSTADGSAALSNGGAGISLAASATNNLIGGSEPGSANLIAYNSSNGVLINPGTPNGSIGTGNQTIANVINANEGAGVRVTSGTGNRISQNSIYANQSLGIDIDASGPATIAHCNTPNIGANNLQNFPTLTAGTGSTYVSATATDPNGNTSEFSKAVAATKTGNLLSLLGNFDSTANTKFNIEFFSSPAADASGYGQGQTYLGSATITTDANCGATITNPIDTTQADVSVTLTQPSLFLVGADMGNSVYTGTVTNNGAATAHNVVFTDNLPAQLSVSSAYCNVASCQSPITTTLGTCTVSGKKITCNLGTMAAGAIAILNIPVQTNTSGAVANTATVSATEVDPNPANNTATASASAVYPAPFIDHLYPSSALVNSTDLPLTIYGEQLVSSSTVTFNGTALPVKAVIDNQACGGPSQPQFCSALQVVVPAALLTTAGTPVISVSNPDPGEDGGANLPSSINFTVAASCTYSVSSFLDGENLEADGSDLIAENASVTTNVDSCPWTATSSVPWAVVLDHASATGSGSVDINIAANTGTTSRTGTVTVAGTTLTFTQDPGSSCPNTLAPGTATSAAAGGTGTTAVTTGDSCAYFVVPYADWLTIPNNSSLLVGSETVSFVVAPNHGASRTGSIAVGGTTLTVTQQAPACYFTLDTNSALIPATGGMGTINVTASAPSCAWTATSSNSAQLSVTSGASGTGNGTVKYSLPANPGGPIVPTLTIGTSDGYSVFTANQASAFTCTFSITPTPHSVSSQGTSDLFTINASFGFCKWTATSNDPTALTINQGSTGTGSGAVYYTVGKNSTSDPRTLTITAGCQTFTINQDAPLSSNPLPAITTLLPASVTAGSGATTLTVTGSNFVNGAVVSYNGMARATTFVGATQLTVALLATDTATAGTFPLTVTNPTPGGGTSNSINFIVNATADNPAPTITTLQPATVGAGAGATTITINGTNFINGSVVSFNGAAKTTTYLSATQLTAALLATDTATAGPFPVTVTNPAPGGGTSNSVNFTVTAATGNNPVPTITTLQPTSVTAGSGAITLTISGTNFINGSVASFNGAAKATSFISATQLAATLLATDVATAGAFPVIVTNQTPGGGTSNIITFTVNPVTAPPSTPQATLSPTALTFPSTSPTVAAAAQIVTLTNSGGAPLSITGITITGANASAFTQTSACGSTLASSANCSISVVFIPPATGTYTANLSVADNASGSPQTVILNGTGSAAPTFNITSANSSQTVDAGGSAQYNLTVAAQNGSFPGTVSLSASGLPQGATASFNPITLSPGDSSASSVLTVQTASGTVAPAGLSSPWTLTLAIAPLFTLFLAARNRRSVLIRFTLLLLATIGVATALTGCGGGFSAGSMSTAKTYNITITGTSGETVQSSTVQLIVK